MATRRLVDLLLFSIWPRDDGPLSGEEEERNKSSIGSEEKDVWPFRFVPSKREIIKRQCWVLGDWPQIPEGHVCDREAPRWPFSAHPMFEAVRGVKGPSFSKTLSEDSTCHQLRWRGGQRDVQLFFAKQWTTSSETAHPLAQKKSPASLLLLLPDSGTHVKKICVRNFW